MRVNYTQRILNILRVQYNNRFKILMGLPRHGTASAVFSRTVGFLAIIRKRAASLMQHVRGSANSIFCLILVLFLFVLYCIY